MERLELNVLALVTQHVHHHLEIRVVGNVARHDVEVCAVEEDLAEELERLTLCDVVVGEDECCVRVEELRA